MTRTEGKTSSGISNSSDVVEVGNVDVRSILLRPSFFPVWGRIFLGNP